MYELTIEPESKRKKKSRQAVKSRQFKAAYIGHLVAGDWFMGSEGPTTRPAWLMFAGPEQALRPFAANLKMGKIAALDPSQDALANQWSSSAPDAKIELLRSIGYRFTWQKLTGGQGGPLAVVTAYLPELFSLDPGLVDPYMARFIAMPPVWWREGQLATLDLAQRRQIVAHMRALGKDSPATEIGDEDLVALVPAAVYAGAMLEKRITRPIVASAAFYLQLYLAGLASGLFQIARPAKAGHAQANDWDRIVDDDPRYAWLAKFPAAYRRADNSFAGYGLAAAGVLPAVGCRRTHAQVDEVLAQETTLYFRVGGAESEQCAA